MCHSSRVPTTPMSASQVAQPTRQNRRHALGTRRALRRSSTAIATIEAITHATPSTITASLRGVGEVMKRVSMSMRPDRPACAATFRSVKTPATCGFFSAERVPAAPGMPMKSAPTSPGLAHRCSVLHAPDSTAGRGATAATSSRTATTTTSSVARTNRPLRLASIPLDGTVDTTSPPAGGSVAIAWHGIERSRANGAPDTSGAVMSVISPSGPEACGHRMVAVVCWTGSSGTSPHSSSPAMPATTAIRRANPGVRSWSSRGTRLDAIRLGCPRRPCGAGRPAPECSLGQDNRSGAGLHSPLRVADPSSSRAGAALGYHGVSCCSAPQSRNQSSAR